MGDGVEIIITPRHLERFVFSLIIIALAVLLIIKWSGGSCDVIDNEMTAAALKEAGTNETNQTINAAEAEPV